MTPPTRVSDLTNHIYLSHRNEPIAHISFADQIREKGCLPLSILHDCARELQNLGHAHFRISNGFFTHFRYAGHQEYLLIDDNGYIFTVQGKPCGEWAAKLPNDRWIFSATLANAA